MTNVFRVLVTGSRSTTPEEDAYVQQELSRAYASDLRNHGPRAMVVVQGECPYGGVDLAAKLWALRTVGVTDEGHEADWGNLGAKAGPIRNSHMVSLGADLCLAFPAPESRGTWDCIRKAANAGIPTRIYPLGATK